MHDEEEGDSNGEVEADAASSSAAASDASIATSSGVPPTSAPAVCLRNSSCTCTECVPPLSMAEQPVGQHSNVETVSKQPTEQPTEQPEG